MAVLSFDVTDVMMAKMAGREVHPWVVTMSMCAILSHSIIITLVVVYYIAKIETIRTTVEFVDLTTDSPTKTPTNDPTSQSPTTDSPSTTAPTYVPTNLPTDGPIIKPTDGLNDAPTNFPTHLSPSIPTTRNYVLHLRLNESYRSLSICKNRPLSMP
eukprot:scaffold34019_cov60-Attheya_sp.AAC.2